MPHSWKAFEVAEKIAKRLQDSGQLKDNSDFTRMSVQGMIQIALEDLDFEEKKAIEKHFLKRFG
jgi:hypothetical protein